MLSVPIEKISPNPAQPRQEFSEEQLRGLAESIRENGILQPVTVRRSLEGGYELIAGERRMRAAKLAGLTEIPAILMESSCRESAIFAILENIQRKDLNIFEEARALKVLINEWGVTQEEAARKLGRAQPTIANKLRLLALTEEEQRFILEHNLTERHARAILTVPEGEARMAILRETAEQHLNVSQLEKRIAHPPKPVIQKRRVMIVKDVRVFMNTINKAIDTMKNAGIPAVAEKHEDGGCIEYRVRIPLHSQN